MSIMRVVNMPCHLHQNLSQITVKSNRSCSGNFLYLLRQKFKRLYLLKTFMIKLYGE